MYAARSESQMFSLVCRTLEVTRAKKEAALALKHTPIMPFEFFESESVHRFSITARFGQ